MQSALWKLMALVGVIGVGVLVVFQAQHGLTHSGEESSSFAEDGEWEDLDGPPTPGPAVEGTEHRAVDSTESGQAAHDSLTDPQAEPTSPFPSERSSIAGDANWQSMEPATAADSAPSTEFNPFANIPPAAESSPPEPEPEQTEDVVNPFADVSSGTAGGDVEPAEGSVSLNAENSGDEGPSPTPQLSQLPSDELGPALLSSPEDRSTPQTDAIDMTEAEPEAAHDTILPDDGRREPLSSSDVSVSPFAPRDGGGEESPADSADILPSPDAFRSAALEQTADPPQPGLFEPDAGQADAVKTDAVTQSADSGEAQPDGHEVTIQAREDAMPEAAEDAAQPLPDAYRSVSEEGPLGQVADAVSSELPSLPPLTLEPEDPQPLQLRDVTAGSDGPLPTDLTSDSPLPIDLASDSPQPGGAAALPSLGRAQALADVAQPDEPPEEFIGDGVVGPDSPVGHQQPQVKIEKLAPESAVLGQPLIYTIRVRNVGPVVAHNVLVEDRIPLGTRLTGTDPRAEYVESDKQLLWRLGSMPPGGERTIRVRVIPTEAGQVGSVSTVSFEAQIASRTVVNAPKLQLTIQGPEEVCVGEQATYKFVLTNAGSADAVGVLLRGLIPPGFEHPGGNDLEYEVGTLPRGLSRDVDLTLLAVAPGTFENHAVLAADGGMSVESAKPVTVLTSRLAVQRSGPENRFVGREAQFTNVVTNQSREALMGVTVVEAVPAGFEFREASEQGRFDPQRRTVNWRIDRLEPGASVTVQTRLLAVGEGALDSTVQAFDARGDTAEVTSRTAVVGFSALTVDVAHAGRPVATGEEVTMRLTVRNGGTAAAEQVATRIEVPRHLRFVEARGPVRHRETEEGIEFEPIGQLPAQGEQTFDIVLAAAEPGDARVRVQLMSAEMQQPIREEESIVIFAEER